MRQTLITLILLLPLPTFAASNQETLQYIIADYQDQCEKAQEDFREIDYEAGDPVVAELELSEDNIYEITIDKDGKTATVLHAEFSCTGIGYFWCGNSSCASYVIVDGVSFTTRGKPVSIQVGDDYVVLIHRGNLACHNGSERSLMVGSPCYFVAAWDDELKTFNSPSSSELVLGVSEFEP